MAWFDQTIAQFHLMKKSKKEHTDKECLPSEAPPEATPADTIGAEDHAPENGPVSLSAEELEALTAAAAKAEEHWNTLLRTTAEFDNFRKRATREKEEAVRYANQALLERLLPVMDSFDMAVTAADAKDGENSQSLKEGINMVLQQFQTVLTKAGLEEIDAHGKPFDPNLHEAVSQLETDEYEEGLVAHQLRKGYLLKERLVRPSSVVVAKKPAA